MLKIRGTNDCGRGVEGTGFVYADDRLMTNAHVVAGVDDPEVDRSTTARSSAEVVYYNPDLDVAVLGRRHLRRCPTLRVRPRRAEAEDGVAILGYPQDGPYDVQPGRIRAEQRLRSPEHLRRGHRHPRGVLAARAGPARATPAARSSPRPATSSGVVFAASVTDRDTGYALTADQVGSAARAIGV